MSSRKGCLAVVKGRRRQGMSESGARRDAARVTGVERSDMYVYAHVRDTTFAHDATAGADSGQRLHRLPPTVTSTTATTPLHTALPPVRETAAPYGHSSTFPPRRRISGPEVILTTNTKGR